MENINTIKVTVLTILSALGALLTNAFGGWSAGMATLVFLMSADYITGLIVAGVFHMSNKTDSGTLESRAGFKGLCRKGMILLYVLIAVRLDIMLATKYIQDAVIFYYIGNEIISIAENAGLMGMPMPQKLRDALDILQNKSGQQGAD